MSTRSRLSELEERLAAVRRGTIDGFAERAAELRAAAARLERSEPGAREEIRRLAHRLRGVAGSAGQPALSERAGRIEDAAASASDAALIEGARRLAAAAERAREQSEPARVEREEAPRAIESLGLRVVALDDEPTTRRLLEITLVQIGGCEAEVVADAATAMQRVRAGDLDLLIVDAMMPDVSGMELYRAARRELGPALRVVILSAASPDELGWELPDDPRLVWLRKPFRPAALVGELRAFCAE